MQLSRDRGAELQQLRTGDGRSLPERLKRQIVQEIDRLELLLEQAKAVKAERADMLAAANHQSTRCGLPIPTTPSATGAPSEIVQSNGENFAPARSIKCFAQFRQIYQAGTYFTASLARDH